MKKIIHDNDFELIGTPVGEVEKVFYSKLIDDKGNAIYTERRRVNIHEEVQSHKDGCLLSTLLGRLSAASGDQIVSALSQVQTISADVSQMPKDLVSAFCLLQEVENRSPGVLKDIASGAALNDIISKFIPSETSSDENENTEAKDGNDNGTI